VADPLDGFGPPFSGSGTLSLALRATHPQFVSFPNVCPDLWPEACGRPSRDDRGGTCAAPLARQEARRG